MWDALFDRFLNTMRTNEWPRRGLLALAFAQALLTRAGWIWIGLIVAATLLCEFDAWLVRTRKSKE